MSSSHPIVIVGASSFGVSVLDAVLSLGAYDVAGFIDNFKPSGTEVVPGYKVLGKVVDIPDMPYRRGVVAISDNYTRGVVWEHIFEEASDFDFVSVVHSSAYVSPMAKVGDGAMVLAGACVLPGAVVEEHAIVNTQASLDHDGCLGAFASLLPAVSTGGNVKIGAYSCIGMGATVIHRVTVGWHSFVSAGSLVVDDIPPDSLAAGCPCRVIRRRQHHENHM